MPNFDRRGFLQLAGAAGLAPLLPILPAPSVGATANGSFSKALWASIHANAGSSAKFVRTAHNMGLSNGAIQGVSVRSVGVRIAATAAASPVNQIGYAVPKSSQDAPLKVIRNFTKNLDSPQPRFSDGIDALVDQGAEASTTVSKNDTE